MCEQLHVEFALEICIIWLSLECKKVELKGSKMYSWLLVNFAWLWWLFLYNISQQWLHVLTAFQLECSGPLLVVGDCKKCSESAVGLWTQRKPANFAVKKFTVL